MHTIRKATARDDARSGFTLIELLIVVIIIGILAAIAIPVFINQREAAWDTAAKSDVRNMATAQETFYTSNNAYTATVDDGMPANGVDLVDEGFVRSDGVAHAACTYTGGGAADDSFVVAASHAQSTATFYWDSRNPTVADSATGLGCTPVIP